MQNCRFCKTPLKQKVLDLGETPYANAYLKAEDLKKTESKFPLNVYVCESCFLMQLGYCADPKDLFDSYSYFSSYSTSWVKHAALYVEIMVHRFVMDASWQVIEIASNDGYLLQHFLQKGIPVLGIEPAQNVARVAEEKGIPTQAVYFNIETAKNLTSQGIKADVLIGNNVLAHVPDINDFVASLKHVLSHRGVVTMEFPHLKKMLECNEFDTIYHEHFFYHSLTTVSKIFAAHGLEIFDVEELLTHGGSLRVFAKHQAFKNYSTNPSVARILKEEEKAGLKRLATYQQFSEKVALVKNDLLAFLLQAKAEGKTVVGYGAPAKGNTLLNYCQLDSSALEFTVDKSPHKQGFYLPGTHIPIHGPEKIFATKPDYILILPWNLRQEIMKEMQAVREWGGQFVVPIPHLQVLS